MSRLIAVALCVLLGGCGAGLSPDDIIRDEATAVKLARESCRKADVRVLDFDKTFPLSEWHARPGKEHWKVWTMGPDFDRASTRVWVSMRDGTVSGCDVAWLLH